MLCFLGLTRAHVVERDVKVPRFPFDPSPPKESRWALFVEGCDFSTIWGLEAQLFKRAPELDLLDLGRLGANDVNAILEKYGVEAARRS